MRVVVHYDLCEGHEQCTRLAPQVFRIADSDEQVQIINENPGEELRAKVQSAARACPMSAIDVAP
jgi:ferredoxin